VVSYDESTSFGEAERIPSWRMAMVEVMTSIEENNTWSLVDLSPDHKPIMVKWMFKVKWDEHRAVSKHKACLMVKGAPACASAPASSGRFQPPPGGSASPPLLFA
jgi:hypothetical protein